MPLSTFSRAGSEEELTYLTKTRTAYIGNESIFTNRKPYTMYCNIKKFDCYI